MLGVPVKPDLTGIVINIIAIIPQNYSYPQDVDKINKICYNNKSGFFYTD
jgi:hypothetical protein